MTFADLLLDLRLRRGLSQEELAAKALVSVRTLSDLERGVTRRPHRDTVRALADALGLSSVEGGEFEQASRRSPPLPGRAAAVRQAKLPAPLTSMIGRDRDVAGVVRLVNRAETRLATVTGPGGVGKSRLALAVGWQLASTFDHVDMVDLSPVGHPDGVPATIGAALGVPAGLAATYPVLARYLGGRSRLVVLDGFEHVLGAAARLAELLSGCAGLTLLVTSRAALMLRGEHLWPLQPLPVPAPDVTDPVALRRSPSVALLVARTQAVRPGFDVRSGNAAVIGELCRRTDGLPLAIELAAAQLRALEPAALLSALDSATVLRADALDVPERQRTLVATVRWSTDRLHPEDRSLLGVLAVFSGGTSAPVLREVTADAGLSTVDVEAAVATLAAVNLVTVADRDGWAHIRMLDTIREVAVMLLRRSALETAVRAAHARYYRRALLRGEDDDVDNVRAAVSWTVHHEPGALDVPLVHALRRRLTSHALFGEVRRLMLAIAGASVGTAVAAWATHAAGVAADQAGDHADAVTLAGRAVELFGAADPAGRCAALTLLGNGYRGLGQFVRAEEVHRECLELASASSDKARVTISLNNLGCLAQDRRDFVTARTYYSESLHIKEQVGDVAGAAVTMANLGALANDEADYGNARRWLSEAVTLLRDRDRPQYLGFALALLSEAELGLGDAQAAQRAGDEALSIGQRIHHPPTIAIALSRLADLAVHGDDPETALRFYEEALPQVDTVPEANRILDRLASMRTQAPSAGT